MNLGSTVDSRCVCFPGGINCRVKLFYILLVLHQLEQLLPHVSFFIDMRSVLFRRTRTWCLDHVPVCPLPNLCRSKSSRRQKKRTTNHSKELEDQLPVEDIIVFRAMAEREVRQVQKDRSANRWGIGGWVRNWLTGDFIFLCCVSCRWCGQAYRALVRARMAGEGPEDTRIVFNHAGHKTSPFPLSRGNVARESRVTRRSAINCLH